MQEADGVLRENMERNQNAGGDLLNWLKFSDGKGGDIHERSDKTHDNGGGIMLTGAAGGYGEGRIAENGDKQAVATDDMEFLFGHGIQGIGSLNEIVERVDYFTSLFMQMYDVTSQLNDVMKPITEKAKTYELRIMSTGSVTSHYDEDTDTTGMGKSMDSLMNSIRNNNK